MNQHRTETAGRSTGRETSAADYAFEVKYQSANGRTQTIVEHVSVAGSQGATAAKELVAARKEVRRILGCKPLGQVGVASQQGKMPRTHK